jgi:hypothetical protein
MQEEYSKFEKKRGPQSVFCFLGWWLSNSNQGDPSFGFIDFDPEQNNLGAYVSSKMGYSYLVMFITQL